ncbi:uncharacterized protein [Physcomitrium patens]|uniref:Uncharacterized protein n=1 Tax=Physcomitrium patens TaxID=3218 RepID=A0A2K1IHJ2_PHYPA|nr:uncharacterized protein LOC112276334 [Physcomitrium patens]PNR28745.1 hypothetical protein PHYPA_029338 [Physcomitrium patens]|eukprot:XP_024363329.1 uncharacterized protein LOC112276334 [Physcomitrella patens]
MGMCAVRGPLVMRSAEEDGEATPRSTMSTSSCASGLSQELEAAEVVDHYDRDGNGALWQRTIPKGRRCRPLSFSGIITYDESGNRLPSRILEEAHGEGLD